MAGQGLATSTFQALTNYALGQYNRVFAEVDVNNKRSITLLRRTGYEEPEPGKVVERDWGKVLTFDAPK